MKKIQELIAKINFKKAVKIYIIASVIILTACLSVTIYLIRDKIALAVDYKKMNNTVDEKGIDISIKQSLNKLANDSPDIKDVLLMDSENNILYKAKNSAIGKNNKMVLSYTNEKEKYLSDINNPDIYYIAVRPDKLFDLKNSIKEMRTIKEGHDDDFFYKTSFNTKKFYLLNYFTDKNNGMKIFVISDITLMPYAENMFKAITAICAVIFMIYWIGLAFWVYKDADKKKMNAPLFALIVLITNIIGLLVYTMVKQNSEMCYKCGTIQNRSNIYCYNCGTKLNNSCSSCGAIVHEKDKYCIKCGKKLI